MARKDFGGVQKYAQKRICAGVDGLRRGGFLNLVRGRQAGSLSLRASSLAILEMMRSRPARDGGFVRAGQAKSAVLNGLAIRFWERIPVLFLPWQAIAPVGAA